MLSDNSMRKSFKDSLKVLEADIQHANSLYVTEQRYHCRNSRSRSCPFCRNSLTRVNSGDLWMFIENRDVVDMEMVSRENIRRLIMYIKKLPEIVSETVSDPYDSHLR
ncbi:hypothetical protein GW17_00007332 [Ensete ventricosum]|nr:hypothetical protein GW17_00007332 [Ensete ventricosum]